MALDFFIRKTEVNIEDVGIFRNGKFGGVQNDLDIYFEIGSNRDDESYDEVILYNISDGMRLALMKATEETYEHIEFVEAPETFGVDTPEVWTPEEIKTTKSTKQASLIKVSSGYDTNYGKIGWGRVKKIENHLEKTGDVKTKIQVESIGEILNEVTMSAAYKQNDPISKFFDGISALTGYPVGEINSTYIFPEDFVVDYTKSIAEWIHYFEERTKDAGEECHRVKKFSMLNFIPKGHSLEQAATIPINSNTGLLSLVEHNEEGLSGWDVECFMIPGVFNGLEVHLTASFPREVDGVYVVKEYKYTSNKEKHKVQFTVEEKT